MNTGGNKMDEKLMSLSFSVEANKGVYALLLGSGISYSSGIPTGWGILTELCRRIMILNDGAEEDPIKWYKEKYEKEPLYDEVIEMLAKTSSDRQGLLKEFFEPTAEDIEEKRKLPTAAHQSIAQLVKQGYIRVIITTNFDRLLEQALDELSVQYQTLYHDSDIEGMKPLSHAECTVLKIHGDYRDTRFKNVTDELKSYSEPLSDLLKRIFDEYGIITSGWSAEWDTALRDTIKSVKGRRYSWYWHLFTNEPNQKAKELITFRDGNTIVDGAGADHFFSKLLENVYSINKIKKENPDSLQLKIKKFKRYLTNQQEIQIADLISDETKKVLDYFNDIDYYPTPSRELVGQYIEEIKERVKPLSILISLLSYNVETPRQQQLLTETLERLTVPKFSDGTRILLYLQKLPLQIILYSIGIPLVKSKNYYLLEKILVEPKVRDRGARRNSNFIHYSSPYHEMYESLLYAYSYSERQYHLLMKRFMHPFLEETLIESQIMFDSEEYDVFYDYFEFLRALKYRHLGVKGFFSGKFGYADDRTHIEHLLKEGAANENWNVLRMFSYSEQEFTASLKELVMDLDMQSHPYYGYGLLNAYSAKEN